jgi:GDPmannose 4,6-dehydratase
MWRILQHDEPDDFVLATGRTESVRDFCKLVFEQLELNYEDYVRIDPRYFRPAEVDLLLGDASKAREKLGWHATTDLEELARIMTQHDLELAQREAHAKSFIPS